VTPGGTVLHAQAAVPTDDCASEGSSKASSKTSAGDSTKQPASRSLAVHSDHAVPPSKGRASLLKLLHPEPEPLEEAPAPHGTIDEVAKSDPTDKIYSESQVLAMMQKLETRVEQLEHRDRQQRMRLVPSPSAPQEDEEDEDEDEEEDDDRSVASELVGASHSGRDRKATRVEEQELRYSKLESMMKKKLKKFGSIVKKNQSAAAASDAAVHQFEQILARTRMQVEEKSESTKLELGLLDRRLGTAVQGLESQVKSGSCRLGALEHARQSSLEGLQRQVKLQQDRIQKLEKELAESGTTLAETGSRISELQVRMERDAEAAHVALQDALQLLEDKMATRLGALAGKLRETETAMQAHKQSLRGLVGRLGGLEQEKEGQWNPAAVVTEVSTLQERVAAVELRQARGGETSSASLAALEDKVRAACREVGVAGVACTGKVVRMAATKLNTHARLIAELAPLTANPNITALATGALRRDIESASRERDARVSGLEKYVMNSRVNLPLPPPAGACSKSEMRTDSGCSSGSLSQRGFSHGWSSHHHSFQAEALCLSTDHGRTEAESVHF
ncbi:hypothetical protein CYMTET_30408, partial [Cymbomonas tetramitiformis]